MARPAVPTSERIASVVLLILLAGLVGVVLLRPAPPEGGSARPGGAPTAYALPADWKLDEPWQSYPEERIYEKIDGRATLFQEYGIERLDWAAASRAGASFEIDVYVMKSPNAALGVFLKEAPTETKPASIGQMGDAAGGLVRAVQGNIYLVVMALAQNADLAPAEDLARVLLAALPKADVSARGVLEMLPAEGRRPGSLAYNKDGTFGLASLTETFTAGYGDDENRFDCLLRPGSAEGLAGLLDKLATEAKEFGGTVERRPDGRVEVVLFGKRLLVAVRNGLLFGVYGKMDGERAEKLLGEFESHVGAEGK